MQAEPQQASGKRARIVFVDDSTKYCSEVAKLADIASVSCFHYTRCLSNEILSSSQMSQLAFQLHAYKEGLDIPYKHDETKLPHVLRALGIQELRADLLYNEMMQLAEADGKPFQTDQKL